MSTEAFAMAAGTATLVQCAGWLRLTLESGAVEVSGRLLSSTEPLVYRSARRGVLLYTMHGGKVRVAYDAATPLRLTRGGATALLPLLEAVKTIVTKAKKPGTRIAVVGPPGLGKSTVARTLGNFLLRRDIVPSGPERLAFVGGDCAGGTDGFGPGVVGATIASIDNGGIDAAAPFVDAMPLCFFGGAQVADAAPEDAANTRLFVVSQAVEAAAALGEVPYMLIDTPAPPRSAAVLAAQPGPVLAGGPAETEAAYTAYFAAVADALRADVVVAVGDYETGPSRFTDLEHALARQHATGGPLLVRVPSVLLPRGVQHYVSPLHSDVVRDAVEDYFCGPCDLPAFRCVRLVVAFNDVALLELRGAGAAASCARLSLTEAAHLRGRVAAVSYAAVEEEVPYANIAGLVVIEAVDPVSGEVIVAAPALGPTRDSPSLPRPFLVVGDAAFTFPGSARFSECIL